MFRAIHFLKLFVFLENFLLTHCNFLPSFSIGVEPDSGSGPRLPDYREALHKCLTGVLSFGGNEFFMLQPFYLCLTAQQAAHAPERLPLYMSQP